MRLFIDMDGTLAEWRPSSTPEELMEEGYFSGLRPTGLINVVKKLFEKNPRFIADTYILSAVIPTSKYAKKEKLEWIRKHLPMIDDAHILFSKDGCSKREYAEKFFGGLTKADFLLDDYGRNLKDWQKAGTAIKFYNGINGSGNTAYKYRIFDAKDKEFSVLTMAYRLKKILSASVISWAFQINPTDGFPDVFFVEGNFQDTADYFKQLVFSYAPNNKVEEINIDIMEDQECFIAKVCNDTGIIWFHARPAEKLKTFAARKLLEERTAPFPADHGHFEQGDESFRSGVPFVDVCPD